MTGGQTPPTAVAAYVRLLETLTPDSLGELASVVTEDVRFADPFNDVSGRMAMCRVFGAMFDDMEDIAFRTDDVVVQGSVCYVRWRFTGRLRRFPRSALDFTGTSRIAFNACGLVQEHVDYWDAAGGFYETLPVVGRILRSIRRRITV